LKIRFRELLIIGCSIFVACQCTTTNSDKPVLTLEIFSPGGIEEVYVITIMRDRSYNVVFGSLKFQEGGKKEFSKVIAKRKGKISQNDWEVLQKHMKEVEKLGFSKSDTIVKDAWRLLLKTKSSEYEVFYEYPKHIPTKVYRLILEIIKLSPMKIDLHGWA